MRSEFEELDGVKDRLSLCYFLPDGNKYIPYRQFEYASASYLNGAWSAWQHRQTEVDELKLDYSKAKLSDIRHASLARDVIFERDELQKRVDLALKLIPSLKAENELWGCDQVERQIELLEQALKGGSND